MAQSRRPSATRHTSKQQTDPSASEPLKDMSSNSAPTTPPYKRRPTGNENRPNPKTSPAKREPDPVITIAPSTSTPAGSATKVAVGAVTGKGESALIEGIQLAPQMKHLGNRRAVSENTFRGTKVTISIPPGSLARSQTEFRTVSIESDNLESTTKGDLHFFADGIISSEVTRAER